MARRETETRAGASPHHLNATRAFMAGAALLASAFGAPARAQDVHGAARAPTTEPANEVAFATPRTPIGPGGGGVGLPQPLTPSTAMRIRQIFLLQEAGEYADAATQTGQLDDHTLLGDILADRYLRQARAVDGGAAPIPTLTASLAAWLRAYPDLPDVRAIHAALLAHLPPGAAAPAMPQIRFLDPDQAGGVAETPEEADPAEISYTRNPALDRSVRERSGKGLAGADAALRLVAHTRGLTPAYAGQLRAEIARDLFTQGLDAQAATVGLEAYRISGHQTGLGVFVAGLAAWRQGDVAAAIPRFEQAARARSISSSLRAGASLWAARAHLRAGDVAGYKPWLECAAAMPRTFYGLLAIRMLGRQPPGADAPSAATQVAESTDDQDDPAGIAPRVIEALFTLGNPRGLSELMLAPAQAAGSRHGAAEGPKPGDPVLGEIDVEAVGATAAGRRAFALLQIGQDARAEAALRGLWASAGHDPALRRSIMLVARAAELTSLAAQTATLIETQDGAIGDTAADAARFPMPRLHPAHGFMTDPALVYALTRLESNFDAGAVSDAGAHGLMQLMPVTAGYVTGNPDRFTGAPARLHDASLNLDLGQRYVDYLAHASSVDGSLIKLLASYNAGPNAIRSWAAANETDPLLFIEAIPVDETRNFVRRGLTYLWIYATRMHLPAPSLTALARGDWPDYAQESPLAASPIRLATLH